MALIEKTPTPNRYKADPSVLTALRTPRILTREVLAGLVVATALIPEAISFSIIAGVDPRVGLFSSFVMAVSIAFLGGRPAMITAATGAVALVIAPVALDYGMDYFIATVILAGLLQVILGVLGVAKLMRFIPRSVMVGFVNSLAILIFIAQLPHLLGVPVMVYPLVAIGIIIMVVMPRFTKIVPAPLVAIVLLTIATVTIAITVPTVGDQGELPKSLPELFIPNVPLTSETLSIIAPYALAMAMVGILESLMTAKLVDEVTDTHSHKTRETWGQGVANMLSGFFGGMGGCAMIGQTMINVKASGARTRISTFLAGVFLLILVVALGDVVAIIPMAALVAVMIIVSVLTFDWHSIRLSTLKRMPKSETTVMLSTVVVVVFTHNLAIGVMVGVLVAMVAFARRVAHLVNVQRTVSTEDTVPTALYTVTGALFFASSNDLTTQFEYADDPDRVVIDMSASHIWDASTVAALDAITNRYERHGKRAVIVGLNEASTDIHARLAGNLGGGH
ncbi:MULTISPECIES: SulP family inorganic anion transporter [unclassified Cryobacterium]|uniref:SulP family inorganic anion transporter n=1 Tax=unclassified Cryobacterium TaxID=2649013 RepID=UPI001068F1BA|nr:MULTISPECIES: SulP family inorganic anion transporter [unclassified Cryobacterium]TFC54740.1 SulP family inorganic anion transporter [Cryobacterium sp. TMB3-1-2]TFC58272.1 SulP family inorganic anion transporter [Cryobacterium sp. TMB1-7]TFC71487.1 SulP family inorganic anion transporter [Cryobacterium sp. TMB3-15]TFC72298.1 SulP family inorganic anion transporter [Cryobacterium sp. TMB3-10]TFD42474.1 SulP family inorganic anion transporter [Cryobacterium sp. TMB3-12]